MVQVKLETCAKKTVDTSFTCNFSEEKPQKDTSFTLIQVFNAIFLYNAWAKF